MYSTLSASEKRILVAAIVVVVGGIISIIDRWGFGGIIGGLAGLGAAGVILQPRLAPAMKLPAPKATILLALGGIAALGFIVSALQYVEFILNLGRIYTLLFDVGLVAALALAYFAWLNYKAAQRAEPAATAPAAASTPPAPPPPAAEA